MSLPICKFPYKALATDELIYSMEDIASIFPSARAVNPMWSRVAKYERELATIQKTKPVSRLHVLAGLTYKPFLGYEQTEQSQCILDPSACPRKSSMKRF
jgi:hypothetical protein